MSHLLFALILEKTEVVPLEPGNETVQGICDGDGNQHEGTLHADIAARDLLPSGSSFAPRDDVDFRIAFYGRLIGSANSRETTCEEKEGTGDNEPEVTQPAGHISRPLRKVYHRTFVV